MSLNAKNVTVGTTRVQLESTTIYNNITDKIMIIKARASNTGIIYVGFNDAITAISTDTAQLQAGEQITVQRNDFRTAYAIASGAGQVIDIIPFN